MTCFCITSCTVLQFAPKNALAWSILAATLSPIRDKARVLVNRSLHAYKVAHVVWITP